MIKQLKNNIYPKKDKNKDTSTPTLFILVFLVQQ